jgi:hypothetical protein
MPRWLVATLVTLCALLWWAAHVGSASHAAEIDEASIKQVCGVLQMPGTVDETLQTEQVAPAFRMRYARLTPLAGFSVAARVLSREDYHFGHASRLSPTDLALGWGPMSAPGMAERLQVTQDGRWYRYHWGAEGPPLAPADIASHSANMHMVPADDAAASALDKVRAGELVRIDGWLVRIDADEGWSWQSSMSRTDVGAGACELVLVCRLKR